MMVCKCGRSPSLLRRERHHSGEFYWLCPCGKGFIDDPEWERSRTLARAIENALRSHFEESLPLIVRKILLEDL
jgi:hypothetical protein